MILKKEKKQRGRARSSVWPGKDAEGKTRSNVLRMPVYM